MSDLGTVLHPPAPTGERAKALGAFYTPDTAVNFMIQWAVERSDFNVIDPSFGDGIFLKASRKRVDQPQEQLYGIEFDEVTFNANKDFLTKQYQISIDKLWNGDFFDSDSFFEKTLKQHSPVQFFDAVVGNPPFIRYQKFKGAERTRALERALDLGVKLPGHVSSWAPFLVYAVSLIKPGGRLAMVAPAELGHAAYATKVLEFLLNQFFTLNILTFQKRLFPKLSEDTFIVLGENKGHTTTCFDLVDVKSETSLESFTYTHALASIGAATSLGREDTANLKCGKTRLLEYLLKTETRALYHQLAGQKHIRQFGTLARIGIGYVTGNNSFFHLSQEEIEKFEIPQVYLTPCVRRGNNLSGLYLTLKDWSNTSETKKWLLEIPATKSFESLPAGLQRYLEQGEVQGVRNGFKVNKREAWYAVPHVKRGAAFLTYMSNDGPRLVHNTLSIPAPNTLHTVELPKTIYDCEGSFHEVDVKLLVVSWYTSLTFLSAELEGHSLGGGMLKLEPGEARKVLIALPNNISSEGLDDAYRKIDRALRRKDLEAALDVGDMFILQEVLGCSSKQCSVLRSGYHHLRDRRTNR